MSPFPALLSPHSWAAVLVLFVLIAIAPVSAADFYIEAELGDTINLHGVSYIGDSVYLFLTGPGLPDNGVTLTDVTQRADQGHFTIVDLAGDQTWSMKWDTSRIMNNIDPGTYYVYVTNEPVDKANLGGTSSYKTCEVYLSRSTTSRVSVDSGNSYMLYPEKETPTPIITIALNTPAPSPSPTTEAPTPAPEPTTLPTTIPTTKSPVQPTAALLAVAVVAAGFLLRQ